MKHISLILLLFSSFLFAQTKIRTHEVYFETDKFDVPPTGHYRLLLFMSEIESMDIKKVSIYGFTDDRGSDSYNLVLSQNRANSIKTIFSNNEYDESIITNVDGKGEILLNIIKEEDIHKIRGLNRKVEIIVEPYNPARTKKAVAKTPKRVEDIIKGELKAGDKFTLDNILFKTGYSKLLPESKPTLESLAEALLELSDIYFTIQGHVCCSQNIRYAIDRKTKK